MTAGSAQKAPLDTRKPGPRDPLGGIGVALYAVCALLPMVGAVGYALAYSLGLTGLLSRGASVEAWRRALADPATWQSLGLSAGIAIVTVVLASVLGLILALVLDEQLSRGPLSYVAYAPLALPFTVAAIVVFGCLTQSGLLSRLLLRLGVIGELEDLAPLVNDRLGVGIVVTHLLIATPFLALVFQRLMVQERIHELRQLAATLGAGPVSTLARITVPLLLRRGLSNVLLVFVVVLGSYEVPLLLGRQSPQMLSVLIMRKYGRFDIEDKPEAFAIAVMYTAIVIGVLVVVFWTRRRNGARRT
jgi:putative spermidine/putrescine transport system permease protein